MKILIFIASFFIFQNSSKAQELNPKYDSTLAKSFGGDDYGNKGYVLVLLKTGTNNMEKSPRRDSLFMGHFQNINRLVDQGKLVIAGPVGKNEKAYRGIFILNVNSLEEANELLQNDPTIKENIFEAELYEWYGSAALSEYIKTHEKIERIKISP